MELKSTEKQKTRLHHQHKNWERNYRDYGTKISFGFKLRKYFDDEKFFLKKFV
jgi:hypothetical protein